jgi:hypothetical protein
VENGYTRSRFRIEAPQNFHAMTSGTAVPTGASLLHAAAKARFSLFNLRCEYRQAAEPERLRPSKPHIWLQAPGTRMCFPRFFKQFQLSHFGRIVVESLNDGGKGWSRK